MYDILIYVLKAWTQKQDKSTCFGSTYTKIGTIQRNPGTRSPIFLPRYKNKKKSGSTSAATSTPAATSTSAATSTLAVALSPQQTTITIPLLITICQQTTPHTNSNTPIVLTEIRDRSVCGVD